jgi:Ser/Thr protein kinase RdoA (MazF antagonist)
MPYPRAVSDVPKEVLAAFGLEGATIEPISVGLINRSFALEKDGERYALQRLHPIFDATVNLDIEAVTAHLAAKDLQTPELVRTLAGDAWAEHDGIWRVLTWIDGAVVSRVENPALAFAAAALVARFHRALEDLDHDFHFVRAGVHDTAAHLEKLRAALASHASHPRIAAVRPIADRILALAETRPALVDLPSRIIHGDLKITNVIFDEDLAHAVALVDLDTLQKGSIAVELGDAMRSWCNPAGEDADGRVDVATFEAAMKGYASESSDLLTEEERASIVPGFEVIALELAARFAADALLDVYFGWDPKRFSSRSEHDLVRARSQLTLAESVRVKRNELASIVASAFR